MITVFGSNILDLFVHAADLPPRDTARHIDRHEQQPGGKGANQAVACAKAGAQVNFFGAVGKGAHGREMRENLSTYQIDVSGLKVLQDEQSGLAFIFVDDSDGTHRVLVCQNANLRVKAEWVPDSAIPAGSTLLMQGEINIAETEALCLRAKQNGARTVINLAPVVPLSEVFLENLDILIVNEHEADSLGKDIGVASENKISFATEMFNRYAVSTIVTLGGDGAICCHDGNIYTVSALKVKPVDTIGAGDAFVGYLCAALDRGESMETALTAASVAGSLACTRVGAQTALPDIDEVTNYKSQVSVTKTGMTPPALTA